MYTSEKNIINIFSQLINVLFVFLNNISDKCGH